MNSKDIDWILTDSIRARRDDWTPGWMITNETSTKHCYLSWWTPKGTEPQNQSPILLFNGEYIETEQFMAYVGLIDQIEDSPNLDIICTEDFELIEL